MFQVQREWFANAAGRAMNPDGMFNLTCKDVVDDYAEYIFPGVSWVDTVRPVVGASQVLANANPTYFEKFYAPVRADWLPIAGDIVVYGGTPQNGYGHVVVCESSDFTAGMTVIEQNGTGNSLVPAARVRRGWNVPGAGTVIGWLRPSYAHMRPDSAPAGPPVAGPQIKIVTSEVANVRTSPDVRPDNIAPAYPHGIAKGANVACVGYVAGQDPYPNDGVQDDAWIKTVSGYYIWANNLGNDLTGLPAL